MGRIAEAKQVLQPFCFRLPKSGTTDAYFGATRSFWNDLVLPTQANGFRPQVKSVVRKQAGTRRGIRFILFESARDYFLRLAAEQSTESPECEAA